MTERERRAVLRRRPNVESWRQVLQAAVRDTSGTRVAPVSWRFTTRR
jgi:hypothetical protein